MSRHPQYFALSMSFPVPFIQHALILVIMNTPNWYFYPPTLYTSTLTYMSSSYENTLLLHSYKATPGSVYPWAGCNWRKREPPYSSPRRWSFSIRLDLKICYDRSTLLLYDSRLEGKWSFIATNIKAFITWGSVLSVGKERQGFTGSPSMTCMADWSR